MINMENNFQINVQSNIQIIFIFFCVSKLLIQLYLNRRNFYYLKKHYHFVPDFFKALTELSVHQKSINYSCAKLNVSFVSSILQFIFILFWLPWGGLNWLQSSIVDYFGQQNEILFGLCLFGLFAIISFFLELPETIYSTFFLEEKFGFNQSTPKIFLMDLFKQALLFIILGLPILSAIIYLFEASGEFWYLYAWIFLTLIQLTLIWAYPRIFAPIFNKFTPLGDGELKNKILELANKTSFSTKDIFIMDASKRSKHGNAYFTGLGKYKRVVFFDNLINQLNSDELVAILAHEIGHFKKKHIVKGLLISLISSFVTLFLMAQLTGFEEFYSGHFVDFNGASITLLLFSMIFPQYVFLITPLSNWFSRKNEYEADEYAAKYSSGEMLISGLVKLYRENASSLVIDSWYSHFYYSHPAAYERIQFLRSKK